MMEQICTIAKEFIVMSSRRHSAMVLSTSIGNSVVAVATDYDAIGIGA